MRPSHFLVSAALSLALPASALANPAEALSITRAVATMEGEGALGDMGLGSEMIPLLGLAAVAVLIMVLVDEKVDAEDESVSAG